MTNLTKKLISQSLLATTTGLIISACGSTAQPPPTNSATVSRSTCSPEKLTRQFEDIARVTEGPAGAAAMLLETGETVSFHAQDHFPMQSVYKFPIGMAMLHQVDQGKFKLDDKIKIEPKEYLTRRQHSPIRDRNPRGAELTLREVLRFSVSESDGTACDVILKLLGGAAEVMKYLEGLGATDIIVANTERDLGEDEQVQYKNWASPESMLRLLRMLHEGKGLSKESRDLILDFMMKSPTGPNRLKGLLPAGTVLAHKTGSSGEVNGLARATNDVGIITLPDGRHLAIAVFLSDTKLAEPARDAVIAKLGRAAWDCWIGAPEK